jgi:hypothetical protein
MSSVRWTCTDRGPLRHVDRGIEPRCGWQTDPTPDWRAPNHSLADDVIQLRLPAPSDAAELHRYALAEGGLEGVWLPPAFGADDPTCMALVEDWLAGWRNEASFHGPALVIVEAGHNELIGQVGLGERVTEAWSSSTASLPNITAVGTHRPPLVSSLRGSSQMA